MKIQLESWKIINTQLTSLQEDEREENSFDLKTGHFFTDDSNQKFGVGFEITIEDKYFDLNLEAVFLFSVDSPITEEFKLSNFPRINAPAIAFPFLRAYISNLTLQSGYDPIILPSINFVRAANESELEEE